jgi:hypothetical protein
MLSGGKVMDPQATLNEMFEAVRDGDIETAQERMFDLATWIGKGGAYPALAPPIMDIIERRTAMINTVPAMWRKDLWIWSSREQFSKTSPALFARI